MPLDEIRYQFRIRVADLARGVEAQSVLVPLHHREDALERLYLRLIAWALWWTPELQIAPATHDRDAPSLFADDLTGRKTLWIAVDPEDASIVGHALRHNRGARVGVAFSDPSVLERFLATARGVKGLQAAEFVLVDQALLHDMAQQLDERRYDVAITIVEDHLYLQAGRRSFDGVFRRFEGPPRAAIRPA